MGKSIEKGFVGKPTSQKAGSSFELVLPKNVYLEIKCYLSDSLGI